MSEERDKVQKIRENFKELEKQISQKTDLKELFDLWRNAHASEVDEIKEQMKAKASINEDDKKIFETELYHSKSRINGIKHKNTISSHFVQFFDRECSCNEPAWEYVLKHAFNMDGGYGTFQPKKDGYKYICLLKEANDSKKVCVRNYKPDIRAKKINEWVMKERESQSLLIALDEAFKIFYKSKKDSECQDFTEEMAYMNINKRGGTSSTKVVDETAVINYAEKYKEFILKEIEILSRNSEEVRVFVCGSKSYFTRLMGAMFGKEERKKAQKDAVLPHNNITFIQISHPSCWKVTSEKRAEEMQRG